MRIVFRADASNVIGSGHVMRCLALADALQKRGAQIEFVCRELSGHLCGLIERRGYNTHRLARDGDDASETRAALSVSGGRPEWLVVDNYQLDAVWERQVRPLVDRILVIDDLANREHDCSLLVDQNLVENMTTRYTGKVSSTCGLLLGPEYALLGSEYEELHNQTRPRRGAIRRILVSFGNADTEDCTGRAVSAVLELDRADVEVDVVVPANFEHLDTLRETAGSRANVQIHESLATLAPLMTQADLALGAGGVTSWERLCLGLPAVVITLAKNQAPIAEELSRRDLIVWLGDQHVVDRPVIVAALRPLLEFGLSEDWSNRCRMVVDGRGARRVCAAMTVTAASVLRARRATALDEDRLLRWANDPETRRNAFSPETISSETHRNWFRDRLSDVEGCQMYIVEASDNLPLGVVRFQRHETRWEVHYSLAQAFRGRGLGRRLLETALSELRAERSDRIVFGKVKESNEASRRVFESLGFSRQTAASDGTILYERPA